MKWIFYGLMAGLIWWLVDSIQYNFVFTDLDSEWKFGLIAVLFFGLGAWMKIRKNAIQPTTTNPEVNTLAESELLSEREKEVLILLAAGHTNAEIAEKLFVSSNTVKTHLSNLYLKLDVNRRTQAVQKARKIGILKDFN